MLSRQSSQKIPNRLIRILLIDDDEQLMEVLAGKLIEQRYAVDIASTGEMGWEFILLFDFDLVVLDWMLPDIDGVKLCQQIRAEGYTMPIMLLTARDRQNDKVLGLDAGADDYVVKPFDFDELTARIRVLLRREINVSSPILEWGNLRLDPKAHEVYHQNQLLPLTPKEYGIIELFMRHPHQVFSPGAIIDNLWAGEDPPGEEAVRTHIKGLRQKLKAVGMAKDTVKTVYGVGYRLKTDDIDDDPQVLLSLSISLEPWGFEITTLDKSTQFWEVLESTEPDILVLDIDMPDLNGIELCQILRSDRFWQHLPVLFLSVHQDEQTQNRAFNIGADDYICKPVTGSLLANRILNRLRRSRIH